MFSVENDEPENGLHHFYVKQMNLHEKVKEVKQICRKGSTLKAVSSTFSYIFLYLKDEHMLIIRNL